MRNKIIIIIIIIIFFLNSAANVPEGLKYQKRMCRSDLGVGVKFCMLRKTAMKADAVKALDSDRNSLKINAVSRGSPVLAKRR